MPEVPVNDSSDTDVLRAKETIVPVFDSQLLINIWHNYQIVLVKTID